MALTAEQQAQVDYQHAVDERRNRLEAVRLAQQTLIENRRNMPVDQREIAAADITAYANTLIAYING